MDHKSTSHYSFSNIFYRNPKFEDYRLKNGEKIGVGQTDGKG
jgi:hypothetical protein